MYQLSEFDLDNLDTSHLQSHFKIQYAHDVYKLEPKNWSEPPHFAAAYYDEKAKLIVLSAMTERGFKALVKTLNKTGYRFENDPYVSVSITGFLATKQILNKTIVLNEYEELFVEAIPEEKQEDIDKLNNFMSLILPDINARRTPDIEAQAAIAGVDIEVARQIVKDLMGRI